MTQLDDADRSALRELARTMVTEIFTSARVRAAIESGGMPDPDFDAELVSAGLWGLEIPEEYGGGGASFQELGTVLDEMGSRAVASQLATTAGLCAGAILLGGSDAQRERWLPSLADRTVHGTAALTEWFQDKADGVRAERRASGWTLSGVASHVLNARVSDLLVVPAASGRDALVAVVQRQAVGVAVAPTVMTDVTRCVDRVVFNEVTVPDPDVLAVGDEADHLLGALANRATVAVAADSVGNARRVVDMTVDYAREREQFGRAIGSFQAVKHQAADMLVNAETSSVLLDDALRKAAANPARCQMEASMAKEHGCERAALNAGTALQLHGGIGYTWEHDLHIYFKRALLNEFLFGDARWHRRRIVRTLVSSAEAAPTSTY